MQKFQLERNLRGRLVLISDAGERVEGVEPVRAFPLTDPRHAISLCDEAGREIWFIDDLEELDRETRALVEEQLATREFIPVIQRIIGHPPQSEPSTWNVETDRGLTSFDVESEDSIHRSEPRQVSIIDTRGIRYVIPDTKKLDSHSRRVLERFL